MGTVIWFDPKAGYGFVKADGGSPDMFVRRSAKRGAVTILAAGERVSYELVTSGEPAKTEAVITAKASNAGADHT